MFGNKTMAEEMTADCCAGAGGRTGGAERGRAARALTSLTPDSTSSSEMRLWPSRRSSYRSLMCLRTCEGQGESKHPQGSSPRLLDLGQRRRRAAESASRHLPTRRVFKLVIPKLSVRKPASAIQNDLAGAAANCRFTSRSPLNHPHPRQSCSMTRVPGVSQDTQLC